MPDNLDVVEPRRIGNERAFDAHAVRCQSPHGKSLSGTAPAQAHHDTLEWLESLTVALDDAIHHANGIPGTQQWQGAAGPGWHFGQ